MRILIVHNAYQVPGGEDVVFSNECAMLQEQGHEVRQFLVRNDEIVGLKKKLLTALGVVFSVPMYRKIRESLKAWRPDVVHVHNFFPLISPSVFYACKAERLPVVMTLHNYRIICPTAVLIHNGQICERSLREGPWWAVRHRAYRGSLVGTLMVAGMISLHQSLGTWRRKVDRFIVLSQFARDKFIHAGLPAESLVHKPNFINVGPHCGSTSRDGFLFVGRLSEEKGVAVLAAAAFQLNPSTSVRVAGEGPERERMVGWRHLEPLGRLENSQVRAQMARSVALIVPSICNETFGLVIIEAFATGTPVIASRIGALTELVEDGVTGLLAEPGDAEDLRQKMQWALAHPEWMAAMGRTALERYQALYTSNVNYQMLIDIYREAIGKPRLLTAPASS